MFGHDEMILPQPNGGVRLGASRPPGRRSSAVPLEPLRARTSSPRARWPLGGGSRRRRRRRGWRRGRRARWTSTPAHLVRLRQVHGARVVVGAPAPRESLARSRHRRDRRPDDSALRRAGGRLRAAAHRRSRDTGARGRPRTRAGAAWRRACRQRPSPRSAASSAAVPPISIAAIGPSIGALLLRGGRRRAGAVRRRRVRATRRWRAGFSPRRARSPRNPSMPGSSRGRARSDHWFFDGVGGGARPARWRPACRTGSDLRGRAVHGEPSRTCSARIAATARRRGRMAGAIRMPAASSIAAFASRSACAFDSRRTCSKVTRPISCASSRAFACSGCRPGCFTL